MSYWQTICGQRGQIRPWRRTVLPAYNLPACGLPACGLPGCSMTWLVYHIIINFYRLRVRTRRCAQAFIFFFQTPRKYWRISWQFTNFLTYFSNSWLFPNFQIFQTCRHHNIGRWSSKIFILQNFIIFKLWKSIVSPILKINHQWKGTIFFVTTKST